MCGGKCGLTPRYIPILTASLGSEELQAAEVGADPEEERLPVLFCSVLNSASTALQSPALIISTTASFLRVLLTQSITDSRTETETLTALQSA